MLLLAATLLISGAAILRQVEPTRTRWLPKCVLHQTTGLHCPGCGATRAVHALLNGRVWQAVRFNPLLIVGGPIIAAMIVWQRRRERAENIAIPRITWTVLVVTVLYFAGRNLPSPTRSWLAPPAPASAAADDEAS